MSTTQTNIYVPVVSRPIKEREDQALYCSRCGYPIEIIEYKHMGLQSGTVAPNGNAHVCHKCGESVDNVILQNRLLSKPPNVIIAQQVKKQSNNSRFGGAGIDYFGDE